jgi:hypothetical protein
VLRLGAISQAQVDAVLARPVAPGSEPTPAPAAASPHDPFGLRRQEPAEPEWIMPRGEAAVRAPGTLDSHYAPHARVVLVERPPDGRPLVSPEVGQGPVGLIAEHDLVTPEPWTRLAAPDSAEAYARELYAALRRADELGLAVVVAVLPDPSGGPLAAAVRDRLTRAAHRG